MRVVIALVCVLLLVVAAALTFVGGFAWGVLLFSLGVLVLALQGR